MMFLSKIKTFFAIGFIVLLGISLLGNWYVVGQLEMEKEMSATLSADLLTANTVATNLASTIEALEKEKIAAQDRADDFARMRSENEKAQANVITVFKDRIRYEPCANTPLPDDIDWLWNNSETNDDSSISRPRD